MNTNIIYREEPSEAIGKYMEIHNTLKPSFVKVVCKDALEIIIKQDCIFYDRESD